MITSLGTRVSRGAAIVVLTLLFLQPAVSAGGDDAQPAPRTVAAVRLLVDGEPATDPGLLRLIEIPAGAPLSPVQVRETIVHLMALGRFADVVASTDEVGGRFTLTFAATSVPKVTDIVFRGDLGLSAGELRAAVVEQYSASPPVGRAGDIGRRLEALCRDHGYLNVRVTPRVEPGGRPDAALLVFEMVAGSRARVSTAAVDGEAGTDAGILLERLGLRPGLPLDPTTIRLRASEFEDSLRAKGYFEASVNPQFAFAANGATASVRVTIDRGPLVTLEFRGDPLPLSRQAELVPIKREGSVDEDLLEDGQRNVEEHFRALGYRDAEVSYSRELSGGRLRIVFTVRRGPQYKLAAVDIAGNDHVPVAELRSGLRGQPGSLFVKSTLDADVAALTERYRRLGFATAKITPSLVPQSSPSADQALMAVRLDIVEGPRTLVGTVVVAGHERVPAEVLNAVVSAATGRPYYQAAVARDREAILLELLNRGYQTATVETVVTFDEDRERADIRLLIQEGPQILVDHVLIVGNTRTSVRTIERELLVAPGQPLGLSSLVESQRRLIALGLFRRVSVTELTRGSDAGHDVLVSVEEAPPTTLSWGGGVEGSRRLVREGTDGGQSVERLDFAPRGFLEIGRRNLWGKNRTVNLFARVSFRSEDPTEVTTPTGTAYEGGGGYGLSEFRVQASYREPRVLGAASDLLVVGVSERGYRSSFNFDRQIGRAELVHGFSSGVSASGRFSIERTYLFEQRFNESDKLLIDRLFPQVRLSILAGTLSRDRRDDALDPTSGTFLSIDGDLALRSLGSEVGYAKSFVQGFVYRRVPKMRNVIFAAGARVGLAMGFATRVVTRDDDGNPVLGADGQPVTTIVRNVPASERFYAGGSTTLRGFTNDRVGTPSTLDRDGFPLGGMGMVIANAELRFPVWRWIGAVAFADVGNVFARVGEIGPGDFRAAFGLGMRVRWPVLPMIRLDVGINPDSRLFQNGSREKSWAMYLGIGQAF